MLSFRNCRILASSTNQNNVIITALSRVFSSKGKDPKTYSMTITVPRGKFLFSRNIVCQYKSFLNVHRGWNEEKMGWARKLGTPGPQRLQVSSSGKRRIVSSHEAKDSLEKGHSSQKEPVFASNIARYKLLSSSRGCIFFVKYFKNLLKVFSDCNPIGSDGCWTVIYEGRTKRISM